MLILFRMMTVVFALFLGKVSVLCTISWKTFHQTLRKCYFFYNSVLLIVILFAIIQTERQRKSSNYDNDVDENGMKMYKNMK